jgi:tetratricopeptide (TPR) repeat protein
MKKIEDLLHQCTVKLTLPSGGWGTGFFVAPEWILTCAHVVQKANGEPVQVRWQNQENWAKAVVERSLLSPYDLALLRVTLPTDANPPCVYLDEEILSRDPLYLFGYPDLDFPNGCPVTFNSEGLTGDEPELIKFALGQVRPGMSGSPLLNQRTRKVCGIVKFTRDRSSDLGGGAIPTRVILEQFPQLQELQQESPERDCRWDDLLRNIAHPNQVHTDSDGHQGPFLAPNRPTNAKDGLVGRDDLIKDLQIKLAAGGVSALSGSPGVGKTAIAIEIAHGMSEHFIDGVLWAGIGESLDKSSMVSIWASELGIPSELIDKLDKDEDKLRAIRKKIGLRRMLLVFDDVWDEVDASTFRQLGGRNCSILFTTRDGTIAAQFANEHTIVEDLSKEDGFKLLQKLAVKAVIAEESEAKELVNAVGGLPLAITLMGGYLRKESDSNQPTRIREALNNLREAKNRLEIRILQPQIDHHPSLPPAIPVSLRAVIKISYKKLDELSRNALRSLSVFPPKPNAFSEDAALSVCSTSLEQLNSLCDFSLLGSSICGRYQLHQIICDYAQEKLSECSDESPKRRMAEYFAEYTKTNKSDFPKLAVEKENISRAFEFAFEQRAQDTLIIDGVNAFFNFLNNRGLFKEAKRLLEQAEQAAQSLGEEVQIAETLRNLGLLAYAMGDNPGAKEYCKNGLSVARDAGDSKTICALLSTSGIIEETSGDYSSSEKYLLEALPIAHKIDDKEYLIFILTNLGRIRADIFGDNQNAENYFQDALKIAHELNNDDQISHLYKNLGWLSCHCDNYSKGEEYWRESLIYAEKIDDQKSKLRLQGNLGWAAGRQGLYSKAREDLNESLSLAHNNEFKDEITEWTMNLGVVELHCGNYNEAEEHLLNALKLSRQLESYLFENIALENLGVLEIRRGNFEKAEEHLHCGLTRARKNCYVERISALLTFLGEIAIYRKNFTQAQEDLTDGLKLAREIHNRERESFLLQRLGMLLEARDKFEEAEEPLREGLKIAQEVGYRWLTSSILTTFGENYLKQQKVDLAYVDFLEAYQIGEKLESKELIAIASYGLAKIEVIKDSNSKAHCKRSLSILRNIKHFKAGEAEEWFRSSGIDLE